MKIKAIEFLKQTNIKTLNNLGLKITIYKFFYYIELSYEPQIYFFNKSQEENQKILKEVIKINNKNTNIKYGKTLSKQLEQIVKQKNKNEISVAKEKIYKFDSKNQILM